MFDPISGTRPPPKGGAAPLPPASDRRCPASARGRGRAARRHLPPFGSPRAVASQVRIPRRRGGICNTCSPTSSSPNKLRQAQVFPMQAPPASARVPAVTRSPHLLTAGGHRCRGVHPAAAGVICERQPSSSGSSPQQPKQAAAQTSQPRSFPCKRPLPPPSRSSARCLPVPPRLTAGDRPAAPRSLHRRRRATSAGGGSPAGPSPASSCARPPSSSSSGACGC